MLERWDLWRTARLVMSIVVLIAASYYLVVAFDNVTNPASNWAFVKGVLSLEGVPADSGFGWRAIESRAVQAVAYAAIIAGETVAGLLLAGGGAHGVRTTADAARWARGQRLSVAGAVVGLLVFWFGFIVLAGNWWVMYLNARWNALEPAFQNATLTLLTLLGVFLVAAVGPRQDEGGTRSEEGG